VHSTQAEDLQGESHYLVLGGVRIS